MSTTFHVALDVRSAILWPKSRLRGLLHDTGLGRALTPDEAREALLTELSQGHELLSFGDCPAFDPKTGCPGHPEEPDCAGGSAFDGDPSRVAMGAV